jgi:glycosyltransferase involved in cell wall biosynthesis
MPEISVVIPVYGVEKYIQKSIESICNQTFSDYEVIIVDDDSPDTSATIAQEVLMQKGIAYKYFWKKNGGLSDARQYGIEKASGTWITFLDSDDVVDSHYLEVLYSLVTDETCDVGIVAYKTTEEQDYYPDVYDASKKSDILQRNQALNLFLTRRFKPVLPAFIIKKSFIVENNILNAPHCRFSEDDYYMWQVFYSADKVAVSGMELYYYVQRRGSISSSSKADNIMTGYSAFVNLIDSHPEWEGLFDNTRYILPRWVLGALRSTAAISEYRVFHNVANRMNYGFYMKQLASFPEIKAKILSKILLISPRLFFSIVKIASKY